MKLVVGESGRLSECRLQPNRPVITGDFVFLDSRRCDAELALGSTRRFSSVGRGLTPRDDIVKGREWSLMGCDSLVSYSDTESTAVWYEVAERSRRGRGFKAVSSSEDLPRDCDSGLESSSGSSTGIAVV